MMAKGLARGCGRYQARPKIPKILRAIPRMLVMLAPHANTCNSKVSMHLKQVTEPCRSIGSSTYHPYYYGEIIPLIKTNISFFSIARKSFPGSDGSVAHPEASSGHVPRNQTQGNEYGWENKERHRGAHDLAIAVGPQSRILGRRRNCRTGHLPGH